MLAIAHPLKVGVESSISHDMMIWLWEISHGAYPLLNLVFVQQLKQKFAGPLGQGRVKILKCYK